MGKAVPRAVKQRAKFLLKKSPESFSEEFEKNKAAVRELNLPFSKVEQNLMAGFIARTLAKGKKKAARITAKREVPSA